MNLVVGVASMKTSDQPDDTLITYSLGSCLGITVYDPIARVGGLLHVMLPTPEVAPQRAARNPCAFVDRGLFRLLDAVEGLGARREHLIIKVAGGAHSTDSGESDHFQIGKQNFDRLKEVLRDANLQLDGCEVGGHLARTMSLSIADGQVLLRGGGETHEL